MDKDKWFDIEGSVKVDVDENEFNMLFLKWLYSKGWDFVGVIKETEEEGE